MSRAAFRSVVPAFAFGVCALAAVTLAPSPAVADEYAIIGGQCVGSYSGVVSMSFCSNSSGQTEGGTTTQGSAGQQLAGQGTGANGAGLMAYLYAAQYGSFDVPAAQSLLSSRGISVTGGYNRTHISSSALGGNGARTNSVGSINIGYAQDYGDWGIKVFVPLQRSWNNETYDAFDSTSIGIAVAPFYHVMREQIHGIDLDVGAVVGQQYVQYENKAALATGTFNFTGFTNLGEGQLGVYARVAKTIAAGGKLSLGSSVVNNYNYQNKKYLGRSTTDWTTDLGYAVGLGKRTSAIADVRIINLEQHPFDVSTTYGEIAAGVSSHLNDRTSLVFNVSQSFGDDDWKTTGVSVGLNWALN